MDLDQVLAIDREVVVNRDAAAGTEREVFALSVVLEDVQRNFESLKVRLSGRQTGREARHLPGYRHVPLEVRGRNREHIGEIVEASVGGVIAGEKWLNVYVEREEVADGVVVFGAIEPMDRADSARIGMTLGCPVDHAFKLCGQRVVGRRIGPWHFRRRHGSCAQLDNDLLENFGAGRWMGQVKTLEGKPVRMELVAVAGYAVLSEECFRVGSRLLIGVNRGLGLQQGRRRRARRGRGRQRSAAP